MAFISRAKELARVAVRRSSDSVTDEPRPGASSGASSGRSGWSAGRRSNEVRPDDDSPKEESEFDRKFVRCEDIGSGASGVVYVVRPRDAAVAGRRFACKELPLGPEPDHEKSTESTEDVLTAMKELRVIKNLAHPNLVELHDYFIEGDRCLLVMSLLTGGHLRAYLSERGSLVEDDVRGILTGVLRGLEHMHSKGVAHRDLKLENVVLLDEFCTSDVKIIDFGLAKQLAATVSSSTQRHTVCGSPIYMSPELATPLGADGDRVLSAYGVQADMWACGIMMYHLLAGCPPFDSNAGLYNLYKQIRSGKYDMSDPIWELTTDGAKDLMGKMLTLDPKRRITASEALRHPWLLDN